MSDGPTVENGRAYIDGKASDEWLRAHVKQSYSSHLDRTGYFCDVCDTETRNASGLVHFESDETVQSLNVCHDCLPDDFE